MTFRATASRICIGSRNDELVTPIHIASLNLRIKILSVLLKENQVRAHFR